jgi:hypothetical protein
MSEYSNIFRQFVGHVLRRLRASKTSREISRTCVRFFGGGYLGLYIRVVYQSTQILPGGLKEISMSNLLLIRKIQNTSEIGSVLTYRVFRGQRWWGGYVGSIYFAEGA